jgi:DNA helicase HerA-like ATPase
MDAQLSIGQQIIAEDLRVRKLLEDADLVGGIYTMGFERCLVLTNDLWKHRAGGIPKHCFLIATAMRPGQAPDAPEDEEVILLRVVGPASLPAEEELVAIRAEAMREIVTTSGRDASSSSPAIMDVLTRNEIQFSALEAKVLGTFYESEINGEPLLVFGSDIETFYSASRYQVYKPYGRSLSIIASYPEISPAETQLRHERSEPPRVKIGAVRYTSSIRRRRRDQSSQRTTAVPVTVNIEDFIAMKTAVFGMTRMGKSNTMKTLATAIFQHSQETGQRIGQLLFDPAGEYAHVTVQDRTALAQIGASYVTIFRFGAGEDEPGVRSLSTNFFSNDTIDVTWSIITAGLSHNRSNYIQSFLAANVIGPAQAEDDRSEWHRAHRRRAALYAALLKAGFRPADNWSVRFVANRDVVAEVNRVLQRDGNDPVESDRRGYVRLNARNLGTWMEALMEARGVSGFPTDWIDAEMDAMLVVFTGSVGSGYRLLEPLRVFHSPQKTRDYAEEVLEELVDGKIVIVDLSLGGETVLKFISERIINHIVSHAASRFAAGKEPHNLQIYLEEAHNLFNRDRFLKPAENDPYVRLAKEAAKFKIGLVYATQEVTSVDPIILSNTSNWVVTHLNNTIEVRELSKYYDFADFAELTLQAEDVGFARLKTRSGRYIVPVQIDLFDADRVEAARMAAETRE